MPARTITHKSWCRKHQTDYEGEFCFAGFGWAPKRPDDGSLFGDVWASQPIASFGESEVDEQPMVAIEYESSSIHIKVEHLLSLRSADDKLLETFGVEAIA